MKKIIIVGGGIAGLTAGIYGRKAGFQVEIYEKNHVAGGQCMGWNRKNHHIDNCIHWLTGTKPNTELRALWEDVGAISSDTQFVENESFYSSYMNGQKITLWKDLERTKRELLNLSPEDEAEINLFIRNVEYATCCEMPVSKPMDMMNVIDYIKLGKSMANMPKVIKLYGKMTIKDFSERFKHPLLKALFSDYMPHEYQASAFIISYATIVSGNGNIPAGGSLKMANRMQERFELLGGKIFTDSAVKSIRIENHNATGIELESGACISSDYVICATDAMELFDKFIGKGYMNRNWKKSYSDEENYPLFSGFQVAFSIDKQVYSEKGTVIFDCRPFEINEKEMIRLSIKSYEYEKEFAPEGKTVLQANVIQYDDDFKYWKSLSKEEYQLKKKELSKTIESIILEKYPELFDHIEELDCWTPLTYEKYCNAYHGTYMSFITKPHTESFKENGIVEGVSNLYIASQWLQAPGGLPVAAASGKHAIQRILKSEKRNYLFK